MKNIILKSALVLALGVAPGAGLAQTEMLKKKPAQQSEGTQEQGATKPQAESQTEGQAGTQMKKNQQTEGQAQAPAGQDTTAGQKADSSTGTQMKKQTEGQAQAPSTQDTQQQGAETKPQDQTGTTSTEGTAKSGTTSTEGTAKSGTTAPSDDTAKTTDQPSSETTGSINVTTEQQTEIKQVITETKAEPVRDVNFEVNVGVAVPRTIELQPLPPQIVKVVPRYEGYRYFVLADGRIVIVDPDSYEIVLVIV
ncbi:DUF1236 domain-containing protein [Phyllobacterium endophyticum]|uniref:DUF1236 domain-containing protein n=1 Tax=Phyllobacterium endophyticum TaxID=1149773 RepID=A0A2P7APP5_9HYPH|nr:DUF1236 domain-containing protein [Phyllobacterium endophyticum]MBB3233401.1 hypothetical protein [Phyllobacterium endophyticum]PSH56188.1 hypothetical protein CU100_21635 [Phyllobacterium endophyticum]TYR41357.1 DUF1236 domain-containing protein [Phyllobacterium endophyticum]